METSIYQSIPVTYTSANQSSVFAKFINWCSGQEKNHFGWIGGILAIHGCALTPIALFAVIISGANMALFMTVLSVMGAALVTNLSAMPTKITIPVFILGAVIDLAVIIACAFIGFTNAGVYL